MDDIRSLLGVTTQPLAIDTSRWPRSMAQYQVGHQKTVAEINACMQKHPLLFLAGNGYSGIGIPDCIRTGKLAAEQFQK